MVPDRAGARVLSILFHQRSVSRPVDVLAHYQEGGTRGERHGRIRLFGRHAARSARIAAETARTASEDARVATAAARHTVVDAVRATADALNASLEHMRVVEDMRRTLREISDVHELDSN
jgi:hypothetical protein